MRSPLISICIPTYERVEYLKRLLESIRIQTFKNFEVIITDDSKSSVIESFIKEYTPEFPLQFHKNTPSLGTSKNMVEGMKFARSQWIKLVLDDDWFTDENSLEIIAAHTQEDNKIIYSGFITFEEETGKREDRTLSKTQFSKLLKNPYLLMSDNIIGVPSVLMFRKNENLLFDERLNWLTDIECYVRWINEYKNKNIYISKPLITVSYNASQLTRTLSVNPKVVIHDYLLFYYKNQGKGLKNIMVYDTWWRMIRNLKIRDVAQLKQYTDYTIPGFLANIISLQKRIPQNLLSNKIVSKLSMSYSYLTNYNKFDGA